MTPSERSTPAERSQPPGNLLARAEYQQRSAQGDHVARAEHPNLHALAVDLRAVGALQVGQHDLVLVFLDLQVEAADPFVVELEGVAFLAADGKRRGHVGEDSPPVGAVQYSQRD